MADLIK